MEKKNKTQAIKEKLDFIGLNLEEIPKTLKLVEDLKFRPNSGFDEKKYRQYRFVSPKEIQILLSPTNRLDDIKEKYSKASPLAEYLEPDELDEESQKKYATFLRMIDEVKIEDIEKIEKEQQLINKKIPFKVRYSGNYLWQIYYSSATEQYFMIVPTEDKDYSTFFYVLKKQIEKKKAGKIFVPISNVEYTRELLNKTEIQSLENYLWLFTKDWPSIYEVYDKSGKVSLQIVGETEVYGKIKSEYKVKLPNKIDANKFFKLVKALFIVQSELPNYYEFETRIDKQGSLEFYHNNKLMKYDELSEWVNKEYQKLLDIEKEAVKENNSLRGKLMQLKKQSQELEIEYLSKEKQISTYLECKKTFFGKVKYFFKYSNKKNKTKEKEEQKIKEEIPEIEEEKIEENLKVQYTLEEILTKGKETREKETSLKNTKLDINALKLKNKNLTKKIENAKAFIEEIDSHKKSIFEFWKYSNKDEVQALEEGEEEPINIKPHSKVFDYEEDIEEFGKMMDEIQRKIFSKEELDNIYLTTTDQIEIMNKLKTETTTAKEVEQWLKQIKKDLQDEKDITEDEVVDIFGGLSEDTRKISKLANKSHREHPKNKYAILRISKGMKNVEYKTALNNSISIIENAICKNELSQNIAVYKWVEEEKNIDTNEFNVFNLNPEKEIENALLDTENGKVNLYKMNLEKGVKAITFSNCIYYDNQNKTLPVGMDKDTRILANILDTDIKLDSKKVIRVGRLEDNNDIASKLIIKTINVLEYTVKEGLEN